MLKYNFLNHKKGDTFNSRKITINLDLTDAQIDIHFKSKGSVIPSFYWSTRNGSIVIIDAARGIMTLDKKKLNFPKNIYFYDFQITHKNGETFTYFEGFIKILQDNTK